MANQMIALGARAPQTNVLGPAIQQGAQMINMMRQQEALERQNAVAQQQMQLAQAKEQREASAAEIEMAGKQIDFYTKLAGQVMNPQGYQLLLGRLDKEAPEIAEAFRANLPPEQFDRNLMLQMVGSIGDNFKATYGPLETEVVQDQNGNYGVATTGGFSAERGQQGVVPLNVLRPKRAAATTAPSAAGGMAAPQSPAPAPGALRATRGVNTTPADLLQQGQPINRIPLGNPLRPMSYTGEAAQPDLGAVVQQMMETGVVSQSDFEAMRAAAGPDKDQQLAELLRSNNIQIMPNEEPAGGMRSAVYRPEEGGASMQQVQSLQGFEDTGVQFRGKPPMQSPLPGSAQVPLPRVRAEAQAGRPQKEETYATESAKEQAKSDVAFLNEYAKNTEIARNSLNVLKQMVGDATIGKDGKIFIPKGGAAPHEGFEGLVGLGIPGMRLVAGSKEADFDAMYEQVTGAAFLEAFDKLRGGGQITQPEGEKATAAISRLGRNISETAFVRAAAELRDIIQRGLERAEARKAKLEGRAAPASRTGRAPIAASGKRVVRSGTYQGRRVVEYSDGSVEYAD